MEVFIYYKSGIIFDYWALNCCSFECRVSVDYTGPLTAVLLNAVSQLTTGPLTAVLLNAVSQLTTGPLTAVLLNAVSR